MGGKGGWLCVAAVNKGENRGPRWSRVRMMKAARPRASRGVASHPSRIGEISVSARNPPLRRRCPPAAPRSLAPRLLPLSPILRKPRRACHARCIVVLSTAISLSVSRRHRNPSRARVNLSTHVTHTRTHTRTRAHLPHSRTHRRVHSPRKSRFVAAACRPRDRPRRRRAAAHLHLSLFSASCIDD